MHKSIFLYNRAEDYKKIVVVTQLSHHRSGDEP